MGNIRSELKFARMLPLKATLYTVSGPHWQHSHNTPAINISGLKSRVMKLPFLSLKMMVKSGLEFNLKLTEPLQSCCCPVQKYLPRLAELAWQLSRYLWRGSVNFKINSKPRFTIIFKLKTVISWLEIIKRVLAGVIPVTFVWHGTTR